MIIKTGYFVNAKRSTTQRSKVHFVDGNNKPICESVIGKKSSFQWCANSAVLHYIECERCKKAYLKIERKRLNKITNALK